MLSIRKKCFFTCMLFTLLYLGAEVALHWMAKVGYWVPPLQTWGIYRANPYMRYALIPNTHIRLGSTRVDINRLGFRGEEIAVPKVPGTFRIFAIGESTTFGWGAPTHREAWPALLEAKLRSSFPEQRIEIVNAGIPGATSVEQRIDYMLRISRLQPDAILIYHGNNYISFWSWVPEIQTNQLYAYACPPAPGWLSQLLDHSYLYMWGLTRMSFWRRANRPKHDEPDLAALAMLKNNLKGFVADARRMNVRVALATFAHGFDEQGTPGIYNEDERRLSVPRAVATFGNLSPQGARASFPLYNAAVRELAASEGLPLCDLAPAVPQTTQFHTDWCHLTAQGEEVVAKLWFETLRKAGWFKDQEERSRTPGVPKDSIRHAKPLVRMQAKK
jgi:lysophospholipase L1-like esterase